MSQIGDTIDSLARPLTDDAGLDLLEVEVKGSGSRTRVRVVVDRKGGVDLAACQRLSRALGQALDEADPLRERYTLEVTSPGTDRPLRTARDFDRVEGREVSVTVSDGDEAQARTMRGVVVAAAPDALALRDAGGEIHEIAYEAITQAKQELRW